MTKTKTKPKYTTLRGKIYWLHYKLPIALYKSTDLASQLVRLSLNTQDYDKAGSLAQILVFKLLEYCKATLPEDINKEALDNIIITTLVNLGETTVQSIQRAKPKVKAITISNAFKQYNNEMVKAETWRVKTQCDNQAAINVLIELGGDIKLSSIDAAHCRKYKADLMRYPLHRTKHCAVKGLSILELINSENAYPSISTTTVNNQLRKVNTFFTWLVKQGLIVINPITGMKIRQKTSLKAARTGFNSTDLTNIFSSTIYTDHQFLHDYQYWLPLLALYSGARLEELCQLHLADIYINSSIPHYRIDDEFIGQHVKNNSSRRSIPIHPELLALGFDVFLSQKKAQDETKLFGYLKPQRQKYGHSAGKWFGKYKRKLGINDPKKVFHSFRHTMVDSLKQIRAQDYEMKALLGHQSGSVTHDIYGSIDSPINSIYEMLLDISFKEVLINIRAWQ